ncbi:rhomboid family intramembrane serine protease [Microlunatus sp. Gsoil 973]|uniref:rhomboid family intramembrane serine protease n=1 Tax=Microlunatus sp. Gsoil 973 TaxID=2672569 RepID=UPI0012B454DA|nr:rhomboid family intramembrane serine protease [Microlunatus sp. Gsoil 973]QGN33324.1 rhomboid family intramembrane serine protease [Microlunatus sp. Gsoil 973]
MSRPDFQAPSFEGCYRHPDRFTGIRCQRCGKPICGECMNPASVGFQCPDCIRSGRTTVRAPRTAFGGALSTRGGLVTKVLIGVVIGLYVLDLISQGMIGNLLGMNGAAVLSGQLWRLVSYSFLSNGLINTLFVALILWGVGRPLEEQFGTVRYLILYVLGGLGGATALFLAFPGYTVAAGASPAAIGLIAVHTVIKIRRREDIKPDLGLFAILIALNLVLGGLQGPGWPSLVGGIIVGGLAAVALVFPRRPRRNQLQVLGLVGVVVLCLAAMALRTVVAVV